ncbi:hypothetical protein M3Y99_00852900 [Aphelenchoides fujianensis]|nr:hypothetical protein M3Y99_00852900 [Aphelenchoides fujianensis]
METILFEHERYDRLYNCTFYSIDKISLEERRHPFWGVFFLSLYATGFSSYLLCMWAMMASEKRKEASYQLMFLHPLHWAANERPGAVFCSHPTISYVVGCVAVSSWCASTLTSQLLGINRCFVLYNRSTANRVFGGWRRVVWLSLPVVFLFYIQVVLVGAIHFIAGLTYVIIQFFPVTQHPSVIIMASTFYLLSQGAPPVIYIAVNRSLRNQIRRSLRHGKARLFGGGSVGDSTGITGVTNSQRNSRVSGRPSDLRSAPPTRPVTPAGERSHTAVGINPAATYAVN